jgi:hypothetical protein
MISDTIHGIVGSDTLSILSKYFKVDCVFDLVTYDDNMEALYQELAQLKQESYDTNYRFVFLHFDSEYYLNLDQPGFTLINLQRILDRLDIPNYFCIVVSQQDLSKQLEQVRVSESSDDVAIACITGCLHTWVYFDADPNLAIAQDQILKKYISLNRIRRFHRRALVAHLQHENLLEQGIVSYNNAN